MSACTSDDAAAFSEYDYALPHDLIAQQPARQRTEARLLLVERGGDVRGEARCRDLPRLLDPGDLLVVNDSRVFPARLLARRPSGGRVELLLVRAVAEQCWQALARPARRLHPGTILSLEAAPGSPAAIGGATPPPRLTVVTTSRNGYVTVACDGAALADVAEVWGDIPLPPYIHRDPRVTADADLRRIDRERYQTVYARRSGSVAAPTAGLHFDAELLAALRQAGIGIATVTLHVGPGTFRPPTAQDYECKRLHPEAFAYPASADRAIRNTRAAGGRVIAVGTTTLRVLETVHGLDLPGGGCRSASPGDRPPWPAAACGSLVESDALQFRGGMKAARAEPVFAGRARWEGQGWSVSGATRLFIRPPDSVTAADGLLTNFHLPGSSLLMLVAAFGGVQTWRRAYAHAVAARLRFYSYGDAMLILGARGSTPGRLASISPSAEGEGVGA